MNAINYLAVVVSSLVALLASTLWYIVFVEQRRILSHQPTTPGSSRRPQFAKMLFEILRNLVLASVLAYLILHMGIMSWTGAILLGVLAWVGFPLVLLTGSVMWENVPWKLAAIHSGDWLIKLLLISVILGVWR